MAHGGSRIIRQMDKHETAAPAIARARRLTASAKPMATAASTALPPCLEGFDARM
jgi:hypothetical protein